MCFKKLSGIERNQKNICHDTTFKIAQKVFFFCRKVRVVINRHSQRNFKSQDSKLLYIFFFLTYIKVSNPRENLKDKIEKITELELLENKVNKINIRNRIQIKKYNK